MSIVLENNRMDQVCSGFLRRSKILPSILDAGDRTVMRVVVQEERENGLSLDHHHQSCSSSSSSIGVNSDVDDDDVEERENNHKNGEEEEVESKLLTFDSAVDALEEALPLRRGISKFYNGKSKSFASLASAACSSSVKEITKPENAYSRKRKNLLAYSLLYDKGRTSLLRNPGMGGGIAKKPTNSSRNSLAVMVAMNNSENGENGLSGEVNGDNSRSPSISPSLSPVPPPPWRSFSLADLQHCAVSVSALNSNLSSPLMGKRNKNDEVS